MNPFCQHGLSRADVEAVQDEELAHLLAVLRGRLNAKTIPDDVIASSQAFEVYGEIKVYRHLKHFDFQPTRVATVKGEKRPDFRCKSRSGKEYFIEVKSYDVDRGEFSQKEILERGLDVSIEIEKQLCEGRRVAFGEQSIAPYGSVKRSEFQISTVVNALNKKFLQNFGKHQQFALGPTFAMSILDKLILPGRQSDLAPYYHQILYSGSTCVTGALWTSAYAAIGHLLLDSYEFEGMPTNAGNWSREGFLRGGV